MIRRNINVGRQTKSRPKSSQSRPNTFVKCIICDGTDTVRAIRLPNRQVLLCKECAVALFRYFRADEHKIDYPEYRCTAPNCRGILVEDDETHHICPSCGTRYKIEVLEPAVAAPRTCNNCGSTDITFNDLINYYVCASCGNHMY